ncbi:MAG: fumarylacetoacetate hydrolase family protein [Chloroflexi bacterium]|nr:fumarylacetoacetate hydrolase family protein [Chloroflexota bacterium]
MRLVSFDDYRIGVLTDAGVVDVTDVVPDVPAPLKSSRMLLLIEDWDALRPKVEAAAGKGKPVPLDSVRLLAPVPAPRKVYAQPTNYRAHVEEMKDSPFAHGGEAVPADLGMFLKATSAVVGPADTIILPFPDRPIHHESELVMVMGKRGGSIPVEKALEYVFGYTCGLDMTVRGKEDRSKRKSYDTFAPIGPWLVTADEIPDPADLEITLWVNEEQRQHAFTKDMIVDCPNMIANMSWVATMEPGDLIFTGTPDGVGPVVDGDLVTINITKIGDLALRAKARE